MQNTSSRTPCAMLPGLSRSERLHVAATRRAPHVWTPRMSRRRVLVAASNVRSGSWRGLLFAAQSADYTSEADEAATELSNTSRSTRPQMYIPLLKPTLAFFATSVSPSHSRRYARSGSITVQSSARPWRRFQPYGCWTRAPSGGYVKPQRTLHLFAYTM